MKQSFIGCLLAFILVVNFNGSTPPPPATNAYMAWLQESNSFKSALAEALTEQCFQIINSFQGQNTTEATYKLKFAKEVLAKGGAFQFVMPLLTNTLNFTDIGDATGGLGNCANAFTSNIDSYVKAYYQVSY